MSRFFISWLVLLATCLTFVQSQDKRIFGHYGHWGAWSSCKLRYGSCGQGTQVRTRCFFFFFVCHRKTQSKRCHVPCRYPVHGNWATWSRWTTCSATCRGTRTRRRTCTNPAPRYGGRHCRGPAHQSQPCGARRCPTYPVRGKWSPWSRWTRCSSPCRGTQTRRRTCTNPRYRGRYCRGPAVQRRRCGARRCQRPYKRIFGHYGHWGAWSSCKLRYGSCGHGTQVRTRCFFFFFVCHRKTQSKRCHVPCRYPVRGKWSPWSRWTRCSSPCRGTQTRRRTCTNPRYRGRYCRGPAIQRRRCRARRCQRPYPVRGKWSLWSRWTRCSSPCRGTQTRRRTCTNPRYRGRYCRGPAIQRRRCGARCPTKPPRCRPGQTVYDRCGQRCVCGAGGTLTQCTRIRKEFTSMTTAERRRYVRVIKTVSTAPARKRRYDELIGIHKTLFNGSIHETQHFLTWHRWYILQYENLMREVDCHFTVSYWDWSVVSGNPWGTTASDVWCAGDSGLGGNGVGPNQCVTTGPFRQGIWELVPSVVRSRCLRRRFNGVPPDSVAVAELLDRPATRFTEFERTLRVNFHDEVHCLIGGTMCSYDSASAPEFFLHHAMVDKIWTDWQKKSHSHRRAFFHSVNEDLPGTGGRRPQQFLDNARLPGGVRVEYAEIGEGPVARTVRRLRALPLQKLEEIPRERFSGIRKQAIRLFRVSPAEEREARKMQRIIEPKVAISPPKGSAIDRNLGYYHNAVV